MNTFSKISAIIFTCALASSVSALQKIMCCLPQQNIPYQKKKINQTKLEYNVEMQITRRRYVYSLEQRRKMLEYNREALSTSEGYQSSIGVGGMLCGLFCCFCLPATSKLGCIIGNIAGNCGFLCCASAYHFHSVAEDIGCELENLTDEPAPESESMV